MGWLENHPIRAMRALLPMAAKGSFESHIADDCTDSKLAPGPRWDVERRPPMHVSEATLESLQKPLDQEGESLVHQKISVSEWPRHAAVDIRPL